MWCDEKFENNKKDEDKKDLNALLKEAKDHLIDRKQKDYNTYWDLARVQYYETLPKEKKNGSQGLNDEAKKNLETAVDEITMDKNRKFFLKTIKDELNEKLWGSNEQNGFPGNIGIIKEMKKRLDKRNLQ